MKGLRVLLYARVSSPPQKRRSKAALDEPSLTQQIEEMTQASQARGWLMIGTLEEVITGSVPMKERPAGARVYEQAAQDQFDVLLVYDNDRIGRDQDAVVAKVFRADMRFLGKQLFSVHQPVEPKAPAEYEPYQDDAALWLESVSDTASSVNIRQFRRRCAFGMRNRIVGKKLMAGSVPIGYVAERHRLPNGKTVLGERRRDEQYAALVQRLFTEYEAGHSFLKLAGLLNTEGLRTPNGNLWTSTTIKGIINNPVYYGATVYYKDRSIGKPDPRYPRRRRRQHQPMERWLIVEDAAHPALITKEQWEHCQAIKRARGVFWPDLRGEHAALGSGPVWEVWLGDAPQWRLGWGYFSCNRYWKTGKTQCTPNSIKRYVLESHVIDYLAQLARRPEILTQLRVTQTQEGLAAAERECQTLAAQLAGVNGRLAKAREAYEAGVDTIHEYGRRKEELAGQQQALADQGAAAQRHLILARQEREVQVSLIALMAEFAERFRQKPLRLQKLLLREIIARVRVDDRAIKILFKDGPFLSSDYERTLEIVRAYSEASPEASREKR